MTSKPTSWCSAAFICRCFSLGFQPVCSAFVYTTPCKKTQFAAYSCSCWMQTKLDAVGDAVTCKSRLVVLSV